MQVDAAKTHQKSRPSGGRLVAAARSPAPTPAPARAAARRRQPVCACPNNVDTDYEKMDPSRYTSDPLRSSDPPQTDASEAVRGGRPAIDVAAERARTALGAEGAAAHHLNSAGSALPTSATLAAVID